MAPCFALAGVNKPGYSGGGASDLAGLGLFGVLAALAALRKRRVG